MVVFVVRTKSVVQTAQNHTWFFFLFFFWTGSVHTDFLFFSLFLFLFCFGDSHSVVVVLNWLSYTDCFKLYTSSLSEFNWVRNALNHTQVLSDLVWVSHTILSDTQVISDLHWVGYTDNCFGVGQSYRLLERIHELFLIWTGSLTWAALNYAVHLSASNVPLLGFSPVCFMYTTMKEDGDAVLSSQWRKRSAWSGWGIC